MKKVTAIVSHRGLQEDESWRIVHEWEDLFSSALNLPVRSSSPFFHAYYYHFLDKFHIRPLSDYISWSNNLELRFVTLAGPICPSWITKKTIPIIIDFWLKDEEIGSFIKSYRHIPLLLVSNKEVETKLKKFGTPFPVEHFALSLPDRYAFDESVLKEKKYDLCLFGRPDKFFLRLLEQYSEKHSDFTYIKNNSDISNRRYYDNKGTFISDDTGRDSYIALMKATNITCYSTPGIDESKQGANNYNQVTPRLLEMLSCGCQVIGHYPDSEDVLWYGLPSIVPNTNEYGEFEAVLNKMRKSVADAVKTREFLSGHYTTERVKTLVEILDKYRIGR